MANRDIILDVNINDNFEVVYGDTYEYFGYSRPGLLTSETGWKIFRITKNEMGLQVRRQYAEGSPAYVHVFDNYASYTYS